MFLLTFVVVAPAALAIVLLGVRLFSMANEILGIALKWTHRMLNTAVMSVLRTAGKHPIPPAILLGIWFISFDDKNMVVILGLGCVAMMVCIAASRIRIFKNAWHSAPLIAVFLKKLILWSALTALPFRLSIQPYRIPSSSMEPTLLVGDYLYTSRLAYGAVLPKFVRKHFGMDGPRRGDVVVFIPPHKRDQIFIKRIVGLPGEVLEVAGNEVFIDGNLLHEPYIIFHDRQRAPPFAGPVSGSSTMPSDPSHGKRTTVRVGTYFVMGDNRENSSDSRYWGEVSMRDIKGKALFIFFSNFGKSREMIRWERLGMKINEVKD
jgi:signal peptidase I